MKNITKFFKFTGYLLVVGAFFMSKNSGATCLNFSGGRGSANLLTEIQHAFPNQSEARTACNQTLNTAQVTAMISQNFNSFRDADRQAKGPAYCDNFSDDCRELRYTNPLSAMRECAVVEHIDPSTHARTWTAKINVYMAPECCKNSSGGTANTCHANGNPSPSH